MAENSKTYFSTDGSIPTVLSKAYSGPFTVDTTTVITARSFDANGNASLPVAAYFRIASSKENHGVRVKYFPGDGWNHMPAFSILQSTHAWNSYEFSLNREQILPLFGKDSSTFGCTLEGYLQIDQPGNYSFYIRSDDGSKLYVDNKELVNNDGDHGVIEKNGSVDLAPGRHLIKVEYYNGSGGFWLDAFYKGPGIPKQIIPANKLYLSAN